MAHKKSGGKSKNGRDSNPKYLGVKTFDGQIVKPGSIIVRQRGSRIKPGKNTGLGNDYTIFSKIYGVVKFETFGKGRKRVSVIPKEIQ